MVPEVQLMDFPVLKNADFTARFPFAHINLKDPDIPLDVKVTGWSPFIPTDADNSSLPAGESNIHSKIPDLENRSCFFI